MNYSTLSAYRVFWSYASTHYSVYLQHPQSQTSPMTLLINYSNFSQTFFPKKQRHSLLAPHLNERANGELEYLRKEKQNYDFKWTFYTNHLIDRYKSPSCQQGRLMALFFWKQVLFLLKTRTTFNQNGISSYSNTFYFPYQLEFESQGLDRLLFQSKKNKVVEFWFI